MLTINLQGLGRVETFLEGAQKQARLAEVVALNWAAFAGRDAIMSEMTRVFDRVTPWILRSSRVRKARKSDPRAFIDIDYWGNKQGVTADQTLKAEIEGGARRNKRHEVALQRAGILPAGMGIVPGDAAIIDKHGNMSAGQINQILSWFQSFGEQGYSANITDKGRKRLGKDNKKTGRKGFSYFALKAKRGKLLPGVYQRYQTAFGSAVKPVMIFVRMPAYRKRLDFYGVGKGAAEKTFTARFREAFDLVGPQN